MKLWKQNLFIIMTSLLTAYFALYFCQRSLLYFPSTETPNRSSYHALSMEKVSFKTKDGITLSAWYKKAAPNKATIIYFHGNAGHWGHRFSYVKNYLDQGYGVLIFSYRGYGGNLGSPTEQGLYLDGQAANDYLASKNIRCLVYYGESLGSGVAIELATQNSVNGIILQSPYTSIKALANHHYPWSPLEPWDKFNSLSKIAQINKSNLLILHGKQDKLIPYRHSIELYKKANGDKQLKLYPNTNHHNLKSIQIINDVSTYLSKTSQQCFLKTK